MTERTLPKVSVVIPTRDRTELLHRALDSVVMQSYPAPIECLVVFDQTDPSPPAIEHADGRTIRTLVNQRSPGLAGSRNTGALAATGELVAFLDDDDEWLLDKLLLQVDAMERHSAAVASTGIYVHYRGRDIARTSPAESVTFQDLLRSRRVDVHPSTFVMRRDALLGNIGLVDEDIPGSYAEDYEWLLRAARVAPIATVRAPLVKVLWHDSSYFTGRWETIISALTYLLKAYPEFRQEPTGLSRIYGQLAFACAAAGRSREARAWARRSLRANPRQLRGYLALLVSLGVLRADDLRRMAHRIGRGI